ncbi:hypothetical protein [Swaminathania salitolerans]|uniref:Uncharacterized protein n=1 Tax=Swaminathania salitolerans TaxID=182838 RepID=A0A511BSF8_9PROT|nr:hypothetical protein [Swaminathania salitolerans]GBQ13306.1 hypothetical protein AA21291_1463 [Swaminathania salitolerans LMG 21291]GEL03276.1 hypothetical protein SSA02_24390 [Swaminathania salitolerans]
MAQLLPFRPPAMKSDRLWAVMAWQGRRSRIADIHASREAAQADCDWRSRQVREYRQFLATEEKAPLRYEICPIRRADLPRQWRPLPALGFLRGRMF